MVSLLWVPLCSCLFPRAVAPTLAVSGSVWGGGGERGGQRHPGRPRPGHGTSVGLGTGIDPLGGSARARIASCHNNLLLSSRLIDGAELAPCDAPGAPSLPKPPGPGPSLAPWDPHSQGTQLQPVQTHTWAWWVLGPALGLLFPCPPVTSPSHCPTFCPSCLPSWALDPMDLFLIFSQPPTPPSFSSPCLHPFNSLFLSASVSVSHLPDPWFSAPFLSACPCLSAPLSQVLPPHLHFYPPFRLSGPSDSPSLSFCFPALLHFV